MQYLIFYEHAQWKFGKFLHCFEDTQGSSPNFVSNFKETIQAPMVYCEIKQKSENKGEEAW